MRSHRFLSRLRPLLLLPLLASALVTSPARAEDQGPKRVLIALTSHGQLGDTGEATGYYLSEVSHPYAKFQRAGLEVDLVSPMGGQPPMDPHSLDQPDPVNDRFLENSESAAKLEATLRADAVNPDDYAAILFAGGHGVMWDFPGDTPLARVASRIYEDGGVVAAVCHGPAGIVDVKLSDGSYLVTGKQVTAFTNEEEELAGQTGNVPFLLEDTLKARGATFSGGAAWSETVVVSERLVTGQNPMSAGALADAMVRVLRGEPEQAPPRAPGGAGMTVDMLIWFVEKTASSQVSTRAQKIRERLPQLTALSPEGLARITALIPSNYTSTRRSVLDAGLRYISQDFSASASARLVEMIDRNQVSTRAELIGTLFERVQMMSPGGLVQLINMIPSNYTSSRRSLLDRGMGFISGGFTGQDAAALLELIDSGQVSTRAGVIRTLFTRILASARGVAFLVEKIPSNYTSTRVSLINEGVGRVEGPLVPYDVVGLVKRIDSGQVSTRAQLIRSLLPRVQGMTPQDTDQIVDLIPSNYSSTRDAIMEACMSRMGF